MQQIVGQTPPTEPRQRSACWSNVKGEPLRPMAQGQMSSRHAPPHHAEPRKDRHVVLCDRLAADQPQPVKVVIIEKFESSPMAVGINSYEFHSYRNTPGNPEPRAPTGRQARNEQHHRHAVQYAKVNETLGKHHVRTRTHQKRATGNQRPAPPKPPPALPLVYRQDLPHARREQKQTYDDRSLRGPKRICVEILAQIAKIVQIKEEVKQRHPHDGYAAQGIEGEESLCRHARKFKQMFFLANGAYQWRPSLAIMCNFVNISTHK